MRHPVRLNSVYSISNIMTDGPTAEGSTIEPEFRGRVALVLGASKGIGADTARGFARRGARVVLASRDTAGLDGVAREIRSLGQEAIVLPTDLLEEASVGRLGRDIRAQFGRLDFAFNNSGDGYPPTELAGIPTEAFDRVVAVTIRGTFLAMKQEIPLLLASGGGAIVNMSSTAGILAFQGGSPYVAAKHAVIGLTKAAALDYADRNIRVNAVAPGPIDTHRLQPLPEAYREKAREAVPMRRLGRGAEVAEAVLWLCSDSSRFVTGTTLPVDGGRMAGWA
ncbi:MAG: SDR family oxidoreductase [Thermoplasmata archaeon]|nr:SDR family oxidoreductase [Thermoplasmata archaeon]